MKVELTTVCCNCDKTIKISMVEMENDAVREGETIDKRISHGLCKKCGNIMLEELRVMRGL